ncbi:hypothetical protein SFRURICE_001684 [Spodoptera frugiperda]|nr:hypothetical protein SFRURICE_001684 [Spodoptera frugiperda]
MDPPYVQDPTATKFQGYEPRSVVGYGLRLRAASCYEKPLSDFNLNSCSTNIKTTFDYFCEFCSLKQYNTVLNNRGGMLDLVLGNFEPNQIAVSHSEDPLVSSRISSPQQVTPRSDTSTDWKWRKADFQVSIGTPKRTECMYSKLRRAVAAAAPAAGFWSRPAHVPSERAKRPPTAHSAPLETYLHTTMN